MAVHLVLIALETAEMGVMAALNDKVKEATARTCTKAAKIDVSGFLAKNKDRKSLCISAI